MNAESSLSLADLGVLAEKTVKEVLGPLCEELEGERSGVLRLGVGSALVEETNGDGAGGDGAEGPFGGPLEKMPAE